MGAEDFSVDGRRAVVVGAARSGTAAAQLLASRGAQVTLTDIRQTVDVELPRQSAIRLELGAHRRETFNAADLVVVSPGVPVDQPILDGVRQRGIPVIGELELASRWIPGRIIAITGTKGKSTTTALIGRMLAADGHHVLVGGNIGVPLSSQVDQSTSNTLHVVEASSFQLETITTFRPWIAVWLNVADDHLDRHPTVDAYVSAKARLFANQTAEDWALVNADDPVVAQRTATVPARRVEFALSGRITSGVLIDGDWIVKRTDTATERLVPVAAVELRGRHMLNNVLAAAGAASLAGGTPEAMTRALRGFHGLEHVMEPVGDLKGVGFVNDSKATNVEAARRSIESFDRGVVAIVGGRFKGGDLRQLREPLSTRGRAVVAIGEAAELVREAIAGVVPVINAASMREAVERAYDAAAPDGVVLLAPACASFDWFRDYAERGSTFKQEVVRLKTSREGGGKDVLGERRER